ncbi:MAG: hypothetical protein ACLRSW_14795 [Christensenellaceae bacterium]
MTKESQFPGLDTTKPEESEAYDYANCSITSRAVFEERWKCIVREYYSKITIEAIIPIDAKVHLNSANDWKTAILPMVMTFDIKFGGYWRDHLSFDKQIATSKEEFSVTNPEGLPAGISVGGYGADGWYQLLDCSIAKDAFDNEEFSWKYVNFMILPLGTEEAWANLDNLFVDMLKAKKDGRIYLTMDQRCFTKIRLFIA